MSKEFVWACIGALAALTIGNWVAKNDCSAAYHPSYIDNLYNKMEP